MANEPEVTTPRGIRIAGDYELLRKLGTGGFSTVFEARHRETGLTYAVKCIEFSVQDAERFRKEALYPARIASRSLHVLSVHSFFQDHSEGVFYLVTELIPHGDLRVFLRDQPRPLALRQALEIGLGIAKGLAAIHEQGIVHGDLKPANVLMDRKDDEWIPKIADFGLARSGVSMQISSCASPGYASPEQMNLVSDRLPGPESDLFAFGMVLYELLTGERRAPATDLRGYGLWLALRGDVSTQAMTAGRPSAPSMSAMRPALARYPELEVLVSELTELDGERRLASAAAVVTRLSTTLRQLEHDETSAAADPRAKAPQGPPSLSVGDDTGETVSLRITGSQPQLERSSQRQLEKGTGPAVEVVKKKPPVRLWFGLAVGLVLTLVALAILWNRSSRPADRPSAAQPLAPPPVDRPSAAQPPAPQPVEQPSAAQPLAPPPAAQDGGPAQRGASDAGVDRALPGAASGPGRGVAAPAARTPPKERTDSPRPTQRPPGPTSPECARLLEKLSLGEALTVNERATLSRCP